MALSVHLSAFPGDSDDDDDDDDEDEGDEYASREEEEERENASYAGYIVVAGVEVLCGGTRSSIICIMSFNQIVSI